MKGLPKGLQRVLVTGGAGFIGSNFIHHLIHAHGGGSNTECCPDHVRFGVADYRPGLSILNLDRLTYAGNLANLAGVDNHPAYRFEQADICDVEAVERSVKTFEPEIIVHFAAESHVDRSIAAGEVFVRTNVLGTQVLLDAARRHDVAQFVHVSTDEVYGSTRDGSFRETDHLHPSSPYSASKAASDLIVLGHKQTYGLPVQITRCTNNYGPRQHPEKLLPKLISLAMADQPMPIYGDGLNVRDWLYVKDHCEAILHVTHQKTWGEIWNIGGNNERTNLEIAETILSELGKSKNLLKFVPDRPGHDWRYSLDSSKLRNQGWLPRVPFDPLLATPFNHKPHGVR